MYVNLYYETILNYFQSMDVEKLHQHLKEEYNYQNTTKIVFLNEVARIFDSLRNSGDTYLENYPGVCNASPKECLNCGKNGYRLVGNISRNYFDLIFEMDGEDIKDIYDCTNFKTEKKIKEIRYQESIDIKEDDKATFVKTTEYWVRLNSTNEAMKGIITTPPSVIDFTTLTYWIEKHSIIYNDLGEYSFCSPLMNWDVFLSLYYDLNEMLLFLNQKGELIQEAIYESKNLKDENQILIWLVRYENLFEIGPYNLVFGLEKINNNFLLKEKHKIYFKGSAFENTFYFFEFYKEHYFPLLEKYSTYTEWEEKEAHSNEEFQEKGIDITSLGFHIKKRKNLENIGITIPFYICKS